MKLYTAMSSLRSLHLFRVLTQYAEYAEIESCNWRAEKRSSLPAHSCDLYSKNFTYLSCGFLKLLAALGGSWHLVPHLPCQRGDRLFVRAVVVGFFLVLRRGKQAGSGFLGGSWVPFALLRFPPAAGRAWTGRKNKYYTICMFLMQRRKNIVLVA